MSVAAAKSPFGRLILVSGPEGLLIDRAVADLSLQMRSEAPEVEISEIEAARLDRGTLVEITGPSLFSSRRAAVIYELENVGPDLGQDLVDLATEKLSDLAIILVHGGGAKGKGLVD